MMTPPPRRGRFYPATLGGGAIDSISADLTQGRPAADWICVAASRSILVVDDNDRHLDIIDTILSSVGHEVETCGSGAEAIRRLSMRRYDVVMLDIIMPEVSGVLVAEEMRQGTLNQRTPIIVCTANMAIARKQMEDMPGVAAIIGKPIDTANLILAVARAPVRDRKADRIVL